MAASKSPSVEEELRRFSVDFKLGQNLPKDSSGLKSKRAASCADIEGLKEFSKNFVLGQSSQTEQQRSLDLPREVDGGQSWEKNNLLLGVENTGRLKQVPDSLSIKKSPLLQQPPQTELPNNVKKKRKKRPPSLLSPSFEGLCSERYSPVLNVCYS